MAPPHWYEDRTCLESPASSIIEISVQHGPFEILGEPTTVDAERCVLEALEDEYDDLYHRYGGRQRVRCSAAAAVPFPAGTLRVPVAGNDGIRAAVVLEPKMLYGLYQFAVFGATVAADGSLPVWREPGRRE